MWYDVDFFLPLQTFFITDEDDEEYQVKTGPDKITFDALIWPFSCIGPYTFTDAHDLFFLL